MKETETESFKYTQKNIVVGNKSRTIITMNKKPGVKLGQSKMVASKVIKRKKCGGCSRKRRG